MSDKRRTVISNNVGNSNESDESYNNDEREERMIGGGATLPLTPTLSLIFSQITTPNTSFAFLINPTICHLRDCISDYATCVSVDILLTTYDIPQSIHLLLQDTVVSLPAYQQSLPYQLFRYC